MLILEATDPRPVSNLFASLHGELAFDIGANCGQSVVRLLQDDKHEGFKQVVALEPASESFAVLLERYGKDERVTCVQAAATDHTGNVTLEERHVAIGTGQLTTGAPGHLPWGNREGVRTVPATTVDQMTETYGKPDLLKVDVEGHESLVLEGAVNTLTKHRPYVLVEIHSRNNGVRCSEILNDAGYHLDRLQHGRYSERSNRAKNHYWMVGR